jgi:hypothetical protein
MASTVTARGIVFLGLLSNSILPAHGSNPPGSEGLDRLPPSARAAIYAMIARDVPSEEGAARTTAMLQSSNPPASRPAATIGAWSRQSKLTASDGRKNNELGYSVAISGDTIVVGAPYATVDSKYAQGAAYVFVKPANGWGDMTETAKLTASDSAEQAFFGCSVSISGDTIVVGADGVNVGAGQYQGAAYVFVKPAAGWRNMKETAKLTASDGTTYAYFGSSVSIGGDTVVVGADGAIVGSNKFQGAVYVFEKPTAGWKNTSAFNARLTASDGTRNSQLGYSTGISESTIIAGARSAVVGANSKQGAVYVFVRPANGWTNGSEAAKLTASDGASGDQLAYSVSIDGDVIAAGAPGSNSERGAIYLFIMPANGWVNMTQTSKLTASDGVSEGHLGHSVAIHGDAVVAGAFTPTVGGHDDDGAAYVFTKPLEGWSKAAPGTKLTGGNAGSHEGMGSSVATNGDSIVVGAMNATIGKNPYEGAVHVFK